MSNPEATVEGVNRPAYTRYPPAPTAPDRVESRDILLVDQRGRALIVREPRPVGFRPPKVDK